MEDMYEAVFELFENLLHDAQNEMYLHINFEPKDIRVAAPEYLIGLFQKSIIYKNSVYCPPQNVKGKDFIYRGLTFIATYEMEIAVFNVDYPLYKKEWMLRKVPLNQPYKTIDNRYERYLIQLNPLLDKAVRNKDVRLS